MTRPETIKVKIANSSVRVPLYKDRRTSTRIAEELSERIQEIEDEYGLVSTQEYALRLAFEFATELETLRQEQDEATQELTRRLQRVLTRLRDIALEHGGG